MTGGRTPSRGGNRDGGRGGGGSWAEGSRGPAGAPVNVRPSAGRQWVVEYGVSPRGQWPQPPAFPGSAWARPQCHRSGSQPPPAASGPAGLQPAACLSPTSAPTRPLSPGQEAARPTGEGEGGGEPQLCNWACPSPPSLPGASNPRRPDSRNIVDSASGRGDASVGRSDPAKGRGDQARGRGDQARGRGDSARGRSCKSEEAKSGVCSKLVPSLRALTLDGVAGATGISGKLQRRGGRRRGGGGRGGAGERGGGGDGRGSGVHERGLASRSAVSGGAPSEPGRGRRGGQRSAAGASQSGRAGGGHPADGEELRLRFRNGSSHAGRRGDSTEEETRLHGVAFADQQQRQQVPEARLCGPARGQVEDAHHPVVLDGVALALGQDREFPQRWLWVL